MAKISHRKQKTKTNTDWKRETGSEKQEILENKQEMENQGKQNTFTQIKKKK